MQVEEQKMINTGAGGNAEQQEDNELKRKEDAQKQKLNEMKKDEYKWYKIKMFGAIVLVPIVYLFFFILLKSANDA